MNQHQQASIDAGHYLSSCGRRDTTPSYNDLYQYLARDWASFGDDYPKIGANAAIELVWDKVAAAAGILSSASYEADVRWQNAMVRSFRHAA